MYNCGWKHNWQDTKERFLKWWNHEGLMVGMWGAPDMGRTVHAELPEPAAPESLDERWCDAAYRAAQNEYQLSRSIFPADVLPIANTDLGPGSLALLCGARPDFGLDTVWYHPCAKDEIDAVQLPPVCFDLQNPWWQLTEEIIRQNVQRSQGNYLVGCPDLVENIDVLSSLCGPQTVCVLTVEQPEWVEQKIAEINELWFAAFQRIYDLIKLDDGSSAFGVFFLWGPGKVAKVQCDFSAMLSPKMYRRFVLPSLKTQCDWLDHSLYHLDGTQAIRHLDALLEIEALDAIEWTPQAGVEGGGHSRWYDLYRQILAAGKSVQVVNVTHREVIPLFDAIGPHGVYILTEFENERDAEQLLKSVEPYLS